MCCVLVEVTLFSQFPSLYPDVQMRLCNLMKGAAVGREGIGWATV